MLHRALLSVLCVCVAFTSFSAAAEPDGKGIEFFEKNIRPVLAKNCYKCHSADAKSPKGGLLLDTLAGMRQGGESGSAVVPGSVEDSLLISALRHDDFKMPPSGKLPENVIADFVKWVEMGAPDPRGGDLADVQPRKVDIAKGREFWSFQPPKQVPSPQVKDKAWPRDDIDRFVLAKVEQQGLKPVRDADRVALIRRVYFDLIGLPPSIADVEAFLADKSPKALESLIDRLLDSPQFGERWGRHWLDVARYAESNGNADNTPFPHAWRYRDYVIASFNEDKPYDRFLMEQVAGDLLPADSGAQRNEQLIATGFLALGSKPRAQNNPDFQMDVVAEQIEVTTTTMLGLTVMCARCHDHKFDPIPTSEYYSLAGIFTSTRTLYGGGGGKNANTSGLLAIGADDPKSDQQTKRVDELTRRKREIEAELAQLNPPAKAAATVDNAAQIKQLENQLAKLTASNKKAKTANRQEQIDSLKAQLAELRTAAAPAAVKNVPIEGDAKARESKIAALQTELSKVDSELTSLGRTAPATQGQAMGVAEGTPGDCQICIAGESQKRGDRVPRGVVSVATIGEPPAIDPKQSGRLELAEWIANRDNPLTARVMVNRIWQYLFGRGLVPSVDNFGVLGEKPSHPELLDHLSVRFVAEDWSVKQMIRTIMLTRTYALSSDHDVANYGKDPDNVWLWRMNPRRLDGESFRDAILAVSGQLDLNPPGPSRLPQIARNQVPTVSDAGKHRSVYLPIIRNSVPEALGLFDFADPSIVVGHRDTTTVPAQSLYLMNSPFIVDQSRALAQRLLGESNMDDNTRVDLAYRLSLVRDPTDDQRQRAVAYVARLDEGLKSSETNDERRRLAAWAGFCQSLLASAEFRYLD
jgi:cytochrome c553